MADKALTERAATVHYLRGMKDLVIVDGPCGDKMVRLLARAIHDIGRGNHVGDYEAAQVSSVDRSGK